MNRNILMAFLALILSNFVGNAQSREQLQRLFYIGYPTHETIETRGDSTGLVITNFAILDNDTTKCVFSIYTPMASLVSSVWSKDYVQFLQSIYDSGYIKHQVSHGFNVCFTFATDSLYIDVCVDWQGAITYYFGCDYTVCDECVEVEFLTPSQKEITFYKPYRCFEPEEIEIDDLGHHRFSEPMETISYLGDSIVKRRVWRTD